MATQTLVALDEYLRRVDEGGCPDYLDGTLVERNVGHYRHARVQGLIAHLFFELAKRVRCFPGTEVHLRLTPARFRVADVAVFFGIEPTEGIPSVPPLVVVEVLSPDDRFTEIMDKLNEYREWGIANIWFIDPWASKLSVYTESGLAQVPTLRLPEYDFEITPKDLFD
jgi:Uma2 family endonuclease